MAKWEVQKLHNRNFSFKHDLDTNPRFDPNFNIYDLLHPDLSQYSSFSSRTESEKRTTQVEKELMASAHLPRET